MLIRTPAALILAACMLALPVPSTAQEGAVHDWHITADTVLVDETVDVPGNLTIAENATLTLQGSHLRVGGRLHVHPGASLELHPSTSGAANRLSAHPGGDGFWILVEGRMRSEGSAQVEGLSGAGLETARYGGGGLRVRGEADLDGLHVHNGTAGITVTENGTLALRNATVEDLGELGIAVMGTLSMQETTVGNNTVGLVGRATCNISVEHSLFVDQETENLVVNGCRATVRESRFEGSMVSLVANNNAVVEVRNTTVRDYTIDGLGSYASPGSEGQLRPVVRLRDVLLQAGQGAERGADLAGSESAEFVNVTIQGHASHGIQAKRAVLSVRDSTIRSNGGYGIQLTDGSFATDPGQDNLFGTPAGGDSNQDGAVSQLVTLQIWVLDATGEAAVLPGNLTVSVHRAQTNETIPPLQSQNLGSGAIHVVFDVYTTDAAGTPQDRGPFEFEATYPGRDTPWRAPVDLENTIVLLSLNAPAADADTFPLIPVSVTLASIAAVLLLGSGAGWIRQRRGTRRTEDENT